MVLPVRQVSEGQDWVEVGVAMRDDWIPIIMVVLCLTAVPLGLVYFIDHIEKDKEDKHLQCDAACGVSTHHGCLIKLEVR